MPDPKTIDDLKKELSIEERLKILAEERVVSTRTRKNLIGIINDIENNILDADLKRTETQKKHLNIQKRISDQARKIISLYEDASTTTRKLRKEYEIFAELRNKELNLQRQISLEDKQKALRLEFFNVIGLKKSNDLINEFNENWKLSPMISVLALSVFLLKNLLEVFDKVDAAASDFRINMGFTRPATEEIEKNVRALYFQLAQSGVQAKDLYAAFQAVAQSVGSTQFTTNAMAGDIALMSAQLGVTAGTSAEFARVMGMMGRSTMDAQKDISIFTAKLSEAAGTNLNEVMNDVSNASKSGYQFLSRNPVALAKAAVEAKRMGTSLVEATKSADSLVRFTENVKSEMEASVLLGESINLQRARELAYRKNVAGLNKEILNIAKQTRFEDLDPFQQEAVAKALGKSADELGKMLQSDREMMRIRSDPSLAKQVANYDRLVAASDQLVKNTAANHRLQLSILSNQKAITTISIAWSAIWQRLLEGPVNLLTIVLPKIAEWLGEINYWTKGWSVALVGVAGILGLIVGSKLMGKLVGWVTKGIGKAIKSMMGDTAEGVGKFGKAEVLRGALGIAAIGVALIPFVFSMKLMQGLNWKTFGIAAASLGLLTAAVLGLGLIMESGVGTVAILAGAAALLIIGAAMIPFAFAAKIMAGAIKMLGDVDLVGIAKGLMALTVPLFTLATLTPFIPAIALGMAGLGLALRFIASPMERVGAAAANMGLGMEKTVNALSQMKDMGIVSIVQQFRSLANTITDVSRAVNDLPDIKLEKLQEVIVRATEFRLEGQEKSNEEVLKALDSIRAAVEALRASLEKGGISANVFVDSQRFDSATARALSFKGTLTPQPTFA